jgi:hypothetical protein
LEDTVEMDTFGKDSALKERQESLEFEKFNARFDFIGREEKRGVVRKEARATAKDFGLDWDPLGAKLENHVRRVGHWKWI